ncbi:MAG TPA: hypothetical protein VD839_00700 [Burkholderiales bacterium]|jgi:hypothetical protein|nr:hypothetical protein [Burkholderiales bacterium]
MTDRRVKLAAGPALLAAALMVANGSPSPAGAAESERYEVWALDQADTVKDRGGGLLYIWTSEVIGSNPSAAKPTVIDLAAAAESAGCAVAKRPHMLRSNYAGPPTHAIISNVGSGHVHFVDIASRKIVGCVEGTGNAHNAEASPDDTMVIVADLAGQKLHKIETDYRRNSFKRVETLSLDTEELKKAVGTPDIKPVCHNYTADSRIAYVTLAGGGLLVLDVGTGDGGIPMKVVHAYPKGTVPGIGCGAFRLPEERLVTNGESGAKGGDDFLFVFDTRGAISGKFPNPVKIELPGEDTHSATICVDKKGNEHMLTLMRVSNHVNVVELKRNRVAETLSIVRPFSPDPKPDVGEMIGNRLFVALRGANPLTAINALKNPKRTPGVAVLTVSNDCHSVDWKASDLMPMTNNPDADPHGLNVFRR